MKYPQDKGTLETTYVSAVFKSELGSQRTMTTEYDDRPLRTKVR